jgi:hypothetical protein
MQFCSARVLHKSADFTSHIACNFQDGDILKCSGVYLLKNL